MAEWKAFNFFLHFTDKLLFSLNASLSKEECDGDLLVLRMIAILFAFLSGKVKTATVVDHWIALLGAFSDLLVNKLEF